MKLNDLRSTIGTHTSWLLIQHPTPPANFIEASQYAFWSS